MKPVAKKRTPKTAEKTPVDAPKKKVLVRLEDLENLEAAQEFIDGKAIKPKTREGYLCKLNRVKAFLEAYYSDGRYLEEVNQVMEIKVPLPQKVLECIFTWLSISKDLARGRKKKVDEKKPVTVVDLTHEKKKEAEVVATVEEEEEEDDDHDEYVDEEANVEIVLNFPIAAKTPPSTQDIFAEDHETISVSCMQGYKSALKWWYKEKGKLGEWTPEVELKLESMIGCYERNVADKKARGVMSIKEGKSPLPFSGFVLVCKTLLEFKEEKHRDYFEQKMFAHSFMILSWNLMCRSVSTGEILFDHIRWADDAMVISFARQKNDQGGETMERDRHIYANPTNPFICPVLSLAIYVFSQRHGGGGDRSHWLFGSGAEKRYADIFEKLLKNYEDGYFGAPNHDLGTHSNRKGSITYVSSQQGISAIQVYLRAGWSLGDVPDRYIFGGPGGDQLVGRSVNGLPINSSDFTLLPPRFPKLIIQEITENIKWDNLLDNYNWYPDNFRIYVVPFLAASMIYHYDFLIEHFPHHHPVWACRLFTYRCGQKSFIEHYKHYILAGKNFCNDHHFHATGVPQHLVLTNSIESMRNEIQDFKQQMLDAMKEIPSLTKDELRRTLSINGAISCTREETAAMIMESEGRIVQRIHDGMRDLIGGLQVTGPVIGQGAADDLPWHSSLQNPQVRILPLDYKLPRGPVKLFWNLWFDGAKGVPKLLLIEEQGRRKELSKVDRANFTKGKAVIKELIKFAVEEKLVKHGYQLATMSVIQRDLVFGQVFPKLVRKYYGNDEREDKNHTHYTCFANRKTELQKGTLKIKSKTVLQMLNPVQDSVPLVSSSAPPRPSSTSTSSSSSSAPPRPATSSSSSSSAPPRPATSSSSSSSAPPRPATSSSSSSSSSAPPRPATSSSSSSAPPRPATSSSSSSSSSSSAAAPPAAAAAAAAPAPAPAPVPISTPSSTIVLRRRGKRSAAPPRLSASSDGDDDPTEEHYSFSPDTQQQRKKAKK